MLPREMALVAVQAAEENLEQFYASFGTKRREGAGFDAGGGDEEGGFVDEEE